LNKKKWNILETQKEPQAQGVFMNPQKYRVQKMSTQKQANQWPNKQKGSNTTYEI